MIPPRVWAWFYVAAAVVFVVLALQAHGADLVVAYLLIAVLFGRQSDDWFDRAWIAEHPHFVREWRDGQLVHQRQMDRRGFVHDHFWGDR